MAYARFLVCIFLLCFYSIADGEETQTKPKFYIASESFDFGFVSPNQSILHTFVYENTGSAPLTVDIIALSCSCGAETHTQGEVPPGATGSITIEFLPDIGEFDSRDVYIYATIRTNEPRQFDLSLKAKVRPVVTLTPTEVHVSGTYDKASVAETFTALCLHEDGKPVEITAIEPSDKSIVVELAGTETLKETRSYKYKVYLERPSPDLTWPQHIHLSTSSSTMPTSELAVYTTGASQVVAVPRILVVDIEAGSKDVFAMVELNSATKAEVSAVSVDAKNEALRLELLRGDSLGKSSIRVQVKADLVTEKIRERIRLLDASGHQIGSVPVLVYPHVTPP